MTMIVWNRIRTTTSRMSEREAALMLAPPRSHARRAPRLPSSCSRMPPVVSTMGVRLARSRCPNVVFFRSSRRIPVIRSVRAVTNTSDVTPVAASTSTLSSPIVSQPRRSTSATLTMLLPCPISYASSSQATETGSAIRALEAMTATIAIVTPTAAPMSARTTGLFEP